MNSLFAVMGIKIGQDTAEKELLVKNRESGPVCLSSSLINTTVPVSLGHRPSLFLDPVLG
jgi:hypothetical protein